MISVRVRTHICVVRTNVIEFRTPQKRPVVAAQREGFGFWMLKVFLQSPEDCHALQLLHEGP